MRGSELFRVRFPAFPTLIGLACICAGLAACDKAGDAPGRQATSVSPAPRPAPEEADRGATGTGKFSVSKTSHDFGKVDDTRNLICAFPFENTGSGRLVIRELKSSCGCTVAELTRMSFLAGEGETIRIDWKPKGHGVQAQTVDVFVEGSEVPTRLAVRADVEPKIKVTPLAADFGKVPENTMHELPLILRSDDPYVEVIEVRPKVPSAVVANFVPGRGDGTLGTILVQMLPRAQRGGFATTITIKSRVRDAQSGTPYDYEMEVPVRASVHGALQLEPNGFYVGKVLPQAAIHYPIRLRRPDGSSFGILQAELANCTVPGLQLEQRKGQDQAGTYIDLVLLGSVRDYLGPLRGTVLLLSDVPGDKVQKLSVMGVVRP